MRTKFSSESFKEIKQMRNLYVDGLTILKLLFRMGCEDMEYIRLNHDGTQLWAFSYLSMRILVPYKVRS
jgi:hypothetical protein